MNYATLKEADDYLYNRPNSLLWFGFSENEKNNALTFATIKIDTKKYIGLKTDPLQENQFPRNKNSTIPGAIRCACIEEAFALLTDTNQERRNLIDAGVKSFSIGDLSESYSDKTDTFFISATTKILLKNFLEGGFSVG